MIAAQKLHLVSCKKKVKANGQQQNWRRDVEDETHIMGNLEIADGIRPPSYI